MKERLKFLLYYFLFWLAFFSVARIVFLGFHIEDTKLLTVQTVWGIFKNGIKMDASMAGYLSVIPFLLVAFSNYFKKSRLEGWIFSYTFLMVFLISFIVVADLQVYNVWQYRLDATPLRYLSTPREAWASVSGLPYLPMLASFFILLGLSSYIIYRVITRVIDEWAIIRKREFMPLILALTLALIVPIRGGFQLSPINQSSVYFSDNHFANVSAINVAWNFMSSIVNKTTENINPYLYLPKEKLNTLLAELFQESGKTEAVLNTKRPNVVLIIWESFTEKATKIDSITPNFNRLKQQGLYFSNFYANGDRTDKGLVALLSGYPAQPTTSIITVPNKVQKLPVLSKDFAQAAYRTSFYYGGETEFANIKSYLYSSDFDKITSKNDFAPQDWNSKWGAHDHIVYNRLLDDLNRQSQPFFATMLTLSSHEPFEVPNKPILANANMTTQFLASMQYADESLGKFITEAQKQTWWNNTLIVVVADHGHVLPKADKKSADFRIPMLWLGGALNKTGVKGTFASQTDFAKTLTKQLGFDSKKYVWGKNLFDSKTKSWAYFSFNDGFGLAKPNKETLFDNVGKKTMYQEGKVEDKDLEQGKAFLQKSFQDYLEK